MNRIFRVFCINRFGLGPLHYISTYTKNDSPYRWVGESTRLPIDTIIFKPLNNSILTDKRSRRLPDSTIRVDGVSPTLRITDTARSFKKFNSRLSLSVMRGVVDSAYQWYGESSTPRIVESESGRLRISLIRRVANSPYRWVGESFLHPWLIFGQIDPLKTCFNRLKYWKSMLNYFFFLATPRITDKRSRRLPDSTICGVSHSPTHWYGESTTLRITDTRSRWLTVSPIRQVFF